MAALAKKYGPTVQAEVEIDDAKGEIKITVSRPSSPTVEDPSREISLEEAQAVR
jgi:N utilization substance protein A